MCADFLTVCRQGLIGWRTVPPSVCYPPRPFQSGRGGRGEGVVEDAVVKRVIDVDPEACRMGG